MDRQSNADPASPGEFDWPGPPELTVRLEEEIARAERQSTPLSCLLVVIENLDAMAREHGSELREQTLVYIAAALKRELRSFDRIGMPTDRELLIILPGADGPRGEMVARRVLDRLQAIKVEARGSRRPLRVSVGLAAWRQDADAQALLGRARAATSRVNGRDEAPAGPPEEPDFPSSGSGADWETPGRPS